MNWLYEKQLKNPQLISEVENAFEIKFPEDYKKNSFETQFGDANSKYY